MEEEVMEVLNKTINRWCPECFNHETFEIRMMRALLQVNAFTLDADRIKNGEEPIRTDHPVSLK